MAQLAELKADAVRFATARAAVLAPSAGSLETVLTAPEWFGLTTATPLQRAICRIADGVPLGRLAQHPDVLAAVGDVSALPVGRLPAELYILSGIRTGKSLLAAALAVRASQTCDLSGIGPGETPRVSVVSLKVDLAKVIQDHILGNAAVRPALRALLLGEPAGDSIMLRHPSGRPVEIKIAAGARAGGSLVARWSAGAIFDEAPRMVGAEDGVVNFDDGRAAVLGRMLPGAQLVATGSPWAPWGPIYDTVAEHWGAPSAAVVVVRAAAQAMNPTYWTPERCASLEARDPDVYRTDVLGEFAAPETALLDPEQIDRAVRRAPAELEREPLHHYVAAIDPATRGNAWTLVVLTKRASGQHGHRVAVALARQWRGSAAAPLSPDAVLAEIAGICSGYGVEHVATDQWAADALRDLGIRHGLYLASLPVTSQSKVDQFESLRALVADDRLELAPVPELCEDLRRVRKRVTQQGVRIELPHTADGRHGDYAAALALAASRPCPPPDAAPEVLTVGEAMLKAERDYQDRLRKRGEYAEDDGGEDDWDRWGIEPGREDW